MKQGRERPNERAAWSCGYLQEGISLLLGPSRLVGSRDEFGRRHQFVDPTGTGSPMRAFTRGMTS